MQAAAFGGQAEFDKDGILIADVNGLGPLAGNLTASKRNDIGYVSFSATQAGVGFPPGSAILRLVPRLIGASASAYNLRVTVSGISNAYGAPLPVDSRIVPFRRGDARADGALTILDALFIAQYLASTRGLGLDALTEVNPVNAAAVMPDGVNGDRVTIVDALAIAQKLAGLRDNNFQLIK